MTITSQIFSPQMEKHLSGVLMEVQNKIDYLLYCNNGIKIYYDDLNKSDYVKSDVLRKIYCKLKRVPRKKIFNGFEIEVDNNQWDVSATGEIKKAPVVDLYALGYLFRFYFGLVIIEENENRQKKIIIFIECLENPINLCGARGKSRSNEQIGISLVNFPSELHGIFSLQSGDINYINIFKATIRDSISDFTKSLQEEQISDWWKIMWDCFIRAAQLDRPSLTREMVIGLIGELYLMKNVLVKEWDLDWGEALSVWKGPDFSPKDFQGDYWAIEVKSTAAEDPKKIHISNLSQLEDISGAFFLVHIRFQKCTDEMQKEETFSLLSLIKDIRGGLSPDESRFFDEKIFRLGFKLDDLNPIRSKGKLILNQENEKNCYIRTGYLVDWPSDCAVYIVKDIESDEFPRLLAHSFNLPAGVEAVSYEILIEKLKPFVVGYEALRHKFLVNHRSKAGASGASHDQCT